VGQEKVSIQTAVRTFCTSSSRPASGPIAPPHGGRAEARRRASGLRPRRGGCQPPGGAGTCEARRIPSHQIGSGVKGANSLRRGRSSSGMGGIPSTIDPGRAEQTGAGTASARGSVTARGPWRPRRRPAPPEGGSTADGMRKTLALSTVP